MALHDLGKTIAPTVVPTQRRVDQVNVIGHDDRGVEVESFLRSAYDIGPAA